MNDIVERLHTKAKDCQCDGLFDLPPLLTEAAVEIEQLRVDLDRMTRGTWSLELARLSKVNAELRAENESLRDALQSSLNLQSHYAKLLNQRDRGQRLTFRTIEDWMRQLKEAKRLQAELRERNSNK